MASENIVIPYKSWAAGINEVLKILVPATGIFAALLYFSSLFLFNDESLQHYALLAQVMRDLGLPALSSILMNVVSPIAWSFYLLSFIGLALFRANVFRADIIINSDGILLPLSFLKQMNGRLQRLWSDVELITVIGKKTNSLGILCLSFRTGGRAKINLSLVPPEQLEQLALACELRSVNARKTPEFNLLLDQLHNQKIAQGELSFTQVWEQDMNRRFSHVGFVPFEPGQTLRDGKLKIIRHMSIGGLSAVYLAQRASGERVIVKESTVPRGTNEEVQKKAEEMLRREAEILIRLSHPQIVRVQDFFVQDAKAYLVLDYLPGENLRTIVAQKGPAEENQVREWTRQLCEILNYLHHKDPPIIHRDISPDNIVVGPDGKLVLIDFGTANEFLSAATGTVVGKQSYLPPEQIRGKAVPQSDIYALGATMYFLLTGIEPEPLSQLHPSETNSAISGEIDQLIGDCTNLQLDKRIHSVEEVARRIESLDPGARINLTTRQTVGEV